MTKSDRGTPLTISLQIPTYWTPEQAFAVFELVDELRETIWRCYALQLQQEYRDQRRHHDADYDPIEPTICRSDLQSPSKTQRGLSAPFVAIAPPLRGFTQPLTVPSEADGQRESQNFAPQRHQITANSPIQSALEAVSEGSGCQKENFQS